MQAINQLRNIRPKEKQTVFIRPRKGVGKEQYYTQAAACIRTREAENANPSIRPKLAGVSIVTGKSRIKKIEKKNQRKVL